MARPAVSVLLPVRNAVTTIEASLRSLARQTAGDFEVVVVNDGSIDGSGAVLDDWASRDARFRVLHLGRSGLVAALNAGLALCRAPLVARMDADDISHPDRLAEQMSLLHRDSGVAVVSCLVRHFPQSTLGRGNRLYEDWLNGLTTHEQIMGERFVESPLAHPSVMFRRSVVADAGGYRDMGWAEDYDLWLRLAERGHVFAKVERPLVFWREHDSRLTRHDPLYSTVNFLRCKAYFIARGPAADGRRIVLWGAGHTGRRMSRFLREQGVEIAAVVEIDPRRIGSALHGAPIISVEELPRFLPATVFVAVASRGARTEIRGRLVARGLVEARDFWCVA